MTETPAAAAPAATPAAPAASAPAAAPAAPAAAAPAAVPAAPAAAPAAPAAESLIPDDPAPPPAAPQSEAEKIAAAKELIAKAEAAADPNGGKAWLLTEGVMGVGEKPAWFKADKYRNVAEQAKAYSELEPRFGAFKGAPAEGKYEFTPPDGVEVAMEHPLMQEFTKWAAASQLSQEGYSNILGMLVQYEAAQAPNMAVIKERMGPDADQRISTVAQWGKANLGAEGFATLKAATSGANADAVFRVVEQIIGKTAQIKMPKPGADVAGGAQAEGLAAIKAAHFKRDEKTGKALVDVDPAYRRKVDKMYLDYYASTGQS